MISREDRPSQRASVALGKMNLPVSSIEKKPTCARSMKSAQRACSCWMASRTCTRGVISGRPRHMAGISFRRPCLDQIEMAGAVFPFDEQLARAKLALMRLLADLREIRNMQGITGKTLFQHLLRIGQISPFRQRPQLADESCVHIECFTIRSANGPTGGGIIHGFSHQVTVTLADFSLFAYRQQQKRRAARQSGHHAGQQRQIEGQTDWPRPLPAAPLPLRRSPEWNRLPDARFPASRRTLDWLILAGSPTLSLLNLQTN